MKTLNRTLSLVLVLVMVLGLFGVAGAAFTDQTDIKYKEAVGVMTGIGAINGYEDGSVKPAGAITREEAAKLVAYAVLGADVAKNLKAAVSSFSDVAADRWSAPFIAFCVKEGIINGMGDGTFAPTANVTGYQLAKMMLCAAGYGANSEYIGSGWELAVAVDANKYGIFDDAVDVDFSKDATREEAMLYVFNGIFVAQVEYNTVLGAYVSNKGFNIPATTIAQDTYGSDLSWRQDTDAFGNAATTWTYKGVEIGTYVVDVAYSYIKDMNTVAGLKELNSTFKNFSIADLNGDTAGTGNFIQLNGTTTGNELTAANLVTELANVTAAGRTVQVFVYSNNLKTIRAIAAYDTELAQVSSINATTKTVTVTTINGAKYTADRDNANYKALSAMKVEDYVLVTHVGTTVATIANPTVVTGKLTNLGKTDGAITSVTVNGTAYPVSAQQKDISGLNSSSLSATNDVTLYVDNNGYAIYIDDVTATTPYFFVVKNSSAIVNNVVINMATGYAPDGSVVTLNTGSVNGFNGWYSYAPSTAAQQALNDSEYTLTQVTLSGAAAAAANKFDTANGAINVGDTMFNGANETTDAVPYAQNVKFMFKTSTGIVVKNGVQPVAAGDKAKVFALFDKDAKNNVYVAAVFVDAEPVDTVGENMLYLAKETSVNVVNDKAVYGYIAVIDGVPTPINAKASATVGTFYTYAKDETTGVYSLAVYGSSGVKSSVKNSTKVNDQFNSLTAGYILSTKAADASSASLTNLNAKNATILDLTQSGVDTLAEIAAAKAAGKTVIMSVIYDDDTNSATYNTVKYIYVVAVVEVSAVANTTGDTFKWDETANAFVFTAAAKANTGTLTVSGLPTGITLDTSATITPATNVVTAGPVASNAVTLTPNGSVSAGATATVTIALKMSTTTVGAINIPVKMAGTLA